MEPRISLFYPSPILLLWTHTLPLALPPHWLITGLEEDQWPFELDLCYNFSNLFPEDQLPPGFPTIDMGPQLKVVERTRTATMLCAASGNPDPDISWFKDFLPVNTTNNNGRIKQLRSGRFPVLKAQLWHRDSSFLLSSIWSAPPVLFFHPLLPPII